MNGSSAIIEDARHGFRKHAIALELAPGEAA
jgi:hypothetical protein